jgi:NADH-quinone oxidoreductase subunit N
MPVPYLYLLRLASPEAIIVLTGLLVLTAGLMENRDTVGAGVSAAKPKPGPVEQTSGTGFSSLVAVLGIAFAIVILTRLPRHALLFEGMLVISPLTRLFKIICLALTFFTVLLAHSERSLRNHAEYVAVLLFAAIGLMLLVGSEELLTIFIGLELLGLSLYILTAFNKTDARGAEAGLKYFLFGSTCSAFTLFGISLVYGVSGTTFLGSVSANLLAGTMPPLLAAGVIMTLVGFAFKIAAAPFHLWAPDAYQAGPMPSAAFIASGSKVASFVVLGKIMLVAFAPIRGQADWHAMVAGWSPFLAVLAAISILLGNFVALAQSNVRRLLAYSAVAHGGYTLLGLIAGDRTGFSATLFYTSAYAMTLIGTFAVCAVVRSYTGGDDLRDFAGLWSNRRNGFGLGAAALCMVFFMLSLAGLPPLAGFFGKFYLFSAALGSGVNHGLLWLVIIALFGSLISLYYYLMVLKAIFVDPAAPGSRPLVSVHQPELLRSALIVVLATLVILLGIVPGALVERIFAALA